MKYIVYIFWTWSIKHNFQERGECLTDDNSIENIKAIVKSFIELKARRYCFDCGHLDAPLHPVVSYVDVIPRGETVTYRNEEVLQNQIFRDFEDMCLKDGKVNTL